MTSFNSTLMAATILVVAAGLAHAGQGEHHDSGAKAFVVTPKGDAQAEAITRLDFSNETLIFTPNANTRAKRYDFTDEPIVITSGGGGGGGSW